MDLYDRTEKTRFLGREFLVWLWWKSELFDGRMELAEFGSGEVWLDDQLVLEAQGGGESVEQSKLRGAAPSTTPEAREALRQGKVPTKAKISIIQEEREFAFLLEGETFTLSGVRIPTLLQEEEDERFFERMYLLEETEALLYGLYREFLALRLSSLWEDRIAPAIRDWVRTETIITRDEYNSMLAEVLPSFETVPLRSPVPGPSAAVELADDEPAGLSSTPTDLPEVLPSVEADTLPSPAPGPSVAGELAAREPSVDDELADGEPAGLSSTPTDLPSGADSPVPAPTEELESDVGAAGGEDAALDRVEDVQPESLG